MPAHVDVRFLLDGTEVLRTVPMTLPLLELLRDQLDKTGTRYGCGEGECGACTVLVDGEARDACLTLAVDVDGRTVTTIDGLATGAELAPVQRAFVQHGAVQCGFCSPGMQLAVLAWVERERAGGDLSREALARAVEGNLCRCTGYVKILDAAEAFARPERP